MVSNIFIFLYISREKFVEKFSKCCENGIACLRKGKLRRCSSSVTAALALITVITQLLLWDKLLSSLEGCSFEVSLDSSPGRGYCVVFLDKTLYSHSASLNLGI